MNNRLSKLPTFLLAVFAALVCSSPAFASANIVIQNADPAGVGFNDPTPATPVGGNTGTTLGQQRLNVFQHAANIWGATISSGPTITVRATWEALSCETNSGVLGSAGSLGVWRNFPGAPYANTWFSSALANALAGSDLDPSNAEIVARFNVNIGKAGCLESRQWYLGLDTNHGSNINLVTVLLHEFSHGLGFQTFTNTSTGAQIVGMPSVYDRFLSDNSTGKTWAQMNDSERVASAINTNNLVWIGPRASGDAGSVLTAGRDAQGRPMMYTPNPIQSGSSVSHWDRSGTPNQLMEPIISSNLTHSLAPPQDLTSSLFSDIGWFVTVPTPTPTPTVTPTPTPTPTPIEPPTPTPTPTPTEPPTPTPTPVPTPVSNTVQFEVGSSSVSEGAGVIQVAVVRSGDASGAASVRYSSSDSSGLTSCKNVAGKGSERCDYQTSVGTLRFAAGETRKTFSVPIVNDTHIEGPETFTLALTKPLGVNLGDPSTQVVTIVDNDTDSTAPNAVDDGQFFITQQYIDFLGRMPDGGGLANWMATLTGCPNGGYGDTPGCDRVHVSAGFYLSDEFRGRGYWAYRFYEVAFDRRPEYAEFVPDMSQVGGAQSPEAEAISKNAYADEFVERSEFIERYGNLTNEQFVVALEQNAEILPASKVTLIVALDTNQKTRAQVLREIVESAEVENRFFIRAFVAMQYFGYLRRSPDTVGYNNWVTTLTDNPSNYRHMIFGFIYSDEYRSRFGR